MYTVRCTLTNLPVCSNITEVLTLVNIRVCTVGCDIVSASLYIILCSVLYTIYTMHYTLYVLLYTLVLCTACYSMANTLKSLCMAIHENRGVAIIINYYIITWNKNKSKPFWNCLYNIKSKIILFTGLLLCYVWLIFHKHNFVWYHYREDCGILW